MKSLTAGALLLVVACSSETTPTSIQVPEIAQAVVVNASVPVNANVFVPCANGGAGEDVLLTGNLHVLFTITVASSGNVSIKTKTQPQGVSGVGQITGDIYRGTGGTQEQQHVAKGLTDTFVNNFRLIGPGPDNNLEVHEALHITINANGDVTVFHDNFNATCK